MNPTSKQLEEEQYEIGNKDKANLELPVKDSYLERKKNQKKKKKNDPEYILKEFKNKDSFYTIITVALMTVSIFMQFNTTFKFKTKNSIKTALGMTSSNFYESQEIFNIDNLVKDYENLIEIFQGNSTTPNVTDTSILYTRTNGKIHLASHIRTTIRTVKMVYDNYPINPILISDIYNEPQWATESISPYSKKGRNEYTTNYSTTANTFLEKGGIVFNNTTENFTTFLEKHHDDKIENKYKGEGNNTKRLATLVHDFVVFDYETKFICSVVCTNQFNSYNINQKNYQIRCLSKDFYKTGWNIFRIVCEVLFFIFYFCFFVSFFKKISFMNKNKKRLTHSSKVNLTCGEGCELFCKRFDLSDIIQIITFIMQFICIILWIVTIIKYLMNKDLINSPLKGEKILLADGINLWGSTQNKLLKFNNIYEIHRMFAITSIMLMYYRLIQVLARYVKPAYLFLQTIRESFSDTFSLIIFVTIILCGYSFFSWIYYGRFIVEFGLCRTSFNQTFQFFMGIINSDVAERMFNKAPVLSAFYFFILMFLVRFTSIKLFLGIMFYYFKKVNDDDLKNDNVLENNEEISPSAFTQIILIYSKIVNCTLNCLCFLFICKVDHQYKTISLLLPDKNITQCKYSFEDKIAKIDVPEITKRMYNSKKEEEIKENKKLEQVPLKNKQELEKEYEKDKQKQEVEKEDNEVKNLINVKEEPTQMVLRVDKNKIQVDYQDNYEFSIRNPYFDSQLDNEKIKLFYEGKYRKNLLEGIFFILYLIITIVMFIFFTLSPWDYKFNEYYNKKLASFKDISTLEELKEFYFTELPTYISGESEGEYKFLNSFLLNDSIPFTIKIGENDGESGFRKKEDYTLKKISHEKKSIIDADTIWETDKTYYNVGGYHKNFDLGGNFASQKESIEDLLDNSLDYVIAEMFLDNENYKTGIFIAFKTKTDFGSFFNNTMEVKTLRHELKLKPVDTVKYVFDVLFIIALILFIIFFIYESVDKKSKYEKWYKEATYNFGLNSYDFRNIIMPEKIRKVLFIFNLSNLLNLIIIILSIPFIVCHILVILEEIHLKDYIEKNTKDLEKLRKIFYTGCGYRKDTEMIGITMISLSILKIITMINFNKFFNILVETFVFGTKTLVTFSLILILIQPSFAFLSYVAFGENNIEYSTIEGSILKTFQILCGYYNFPDVRNADKTFATIVLYFYFVVVHLIFVNIFISCLYASYKEIFQKFSNTQEQYSWWNILFNCGKDNKKLSNVTEIIFNELEYDKQLQKFPSKLIIYKEKSNKEDFQRNEKEQIKILDDYLFNLNKNRRDSDLAYNFSKLGKVFMFDDNIYSNINEEQKRSLDIEYLNKQLIIIEQLENDLINIDEAIQQLNRVENMDFQSKQQRIDKEIAKTNMLISNLDEQFNTLYSDIAKKQKSNK